ERVPTHPVSSAQIRDTPVTRLVVRKHSDPLFHTTGLLEWHRKSSFRPKLTCRPSTRSKLSGIYPDWTGENPHPTLPRRRGRDWRGFSPIDRSPSAATP